MDRVEYYLSAADAIAAVKNGIRRKQTTSNSDSSSDGFNEGYECDYGLILTDCSMPFMDGYECSKEMIKIFRMYGIATF